VGKGGSVGNSGLLSERRDYDWTELKLVKTGAIMPTAGPGPFASSHNEKNFLTELTTQGGSFRVPRGK